MRNCGFEIEEPDLSHNKKWSIFHEVENRGGEL